MQARAKIVQIITVGESHIIALDENGNLWTKPAFEVVQCSKAPWKLTNNPRADDPPNPTTQKAYRGTGGYCGDDD